MGSCTTEGQTSFSIADLLQLCIFTPISTWSAVVFVLAFVIHLFSKLLHSGASMPTLFYKESAFSRHLLRNIPLLRKPYCPPIWARHSSVQTLVSSCLLQMLDVVFERQYLQLKDRGVVALDWALADVYHTDSNTFLFRRSTPVLIIIPDLASGALSASAICREAIHRGFRPVVFNRRGQGNCPLTTPRLQPYGDPTDLRQAVKFLRCRLPNARLTALGYGTGSDLLLAYLGEFGSSSFFSACAAISPVYDPERLQSTNLPQLYATVRLLSMRRFLGQHAGVLQKSLDVKAAMNSKSLADFERHVFWKMCSCEDEEQYWEKNAPLRDADEISTPLLCISSRDDPFVPDDVIPYDVFQVYPHLVLAMTDRGGHCGFFQTGATLSWAEALSLDFIKATLDFAATEEKRPKTASS